MGLLHVVATDMSVDDLVSLFPSPAMQFSSLP